MSTELEIVSALDQSINVEQNAIDKLMSDIEYEILSAVTEKDAERAVSVVVHLLRLKKLSGLALAKAFYLIYTNWKKFEVDEDFYTYILVTSGQTKHTVERYIRVQEMLSLAPEEVQKSLVQQNIKQLIPIANAVSQGHEFDVEEWKKLADAGDYHEVSEYVHEITGKEHRKNSLRLWMDEYGSLFAYGGETEERKFVGSLEIDDSDPIVLKAITRIINNANILYRQ